MFEAGFLLFSIVLLIATLALARARLGPAEYTRMMRGLWVAVCWLYREFKELVGTVARRGWRVVLPWVFVYVCAGLGWRVVNGLPLGDVVALTGVLAPLAGTTVVAQVTRFMETVRGVANSSGAPPFIPDPVRGVAAA